MPRGRDEAGNIWELDAQGNPVRLVQPAQAPTSYPGAFVPPNPFKLAEQRRNEQRQSASDVRAERSDQRAAAAEIRAQKKFESEDTVAPPPGDITKTGEEYLSTLPTALAAQVKALSEGRRAFPTGAALRSPAIQQLVAAASQYDPTLDATNAATRVATRKDFTSGKSALNITALNTALGHLGQLWKNAQDLHNRGFPVWNAITNEALSQTGDQRLNNFRLTRKAVADELERVFRGTGGNVSEINEWKSTLSTSSSPEQFRGAMAQAVGLLQSRLEALSAQYSQGMGRSSDPLTFLKPHAQAVFSALQEGGSGFIPDAGGKKAPPDLKPSGGDGPGPSGGSGKMDYSGMIGGLDAGLASGDTRNEFDPVTAAGMAALVKRGRPYEEAVAYARSKGFNPPSQSDYAAAVGFQKAHPGAQPNVAATRQVPVTGFQRFASSPLAAGLSGGANAATMGLNDEIAGGIGALTGGDYTQERDAYNARKNILAENHGIANLIGNVVGGGITAAVGAPVAGALAMRVPGAAAAAEALGGSAPLASDIAYGAAYGAGENNEDRLGGAVMGGFAGASGGMVGRGPTRGLANIIAPPTGTFGPAYAQGVFPTIGQRFGRSGFAGRAINTAEQAMQSMPGLGSLVTHARDIPRDAAQLGAFNESLKELGPFDAILKKKVSGLPEGMQPGTDPHAFTSKAFGEAYDLARSGMKFVPDAQYIADHKAFNGVLNSGVLDANQAAQVQKVISTSVGTRLPRGGGAMAGDSYKQASSDMSRAIDSWSRNPNTQPMANALSEYQSVFDAAARRNSDPQAVSLLDAADRGWAKYARVRNAGARVGGEPGTFTMKNLQRAVQQEGGGVASGPFQRGQALMQDYSTAIQPLGDTLSNSGTGERLLTNKILLGSQGGVGAAGLGTGLGGAVLAHPGALAPFAAFAPGVNHLLTRAIAPRSATLPPVVADFLERTALQTRNQAPLIGRLAVPGALGWELGQ